MLLSRYTSIFSEAKQVGTARFKELRYMSMRLVELQRLYESGRSLYDSDFEHYYMSEACAYFAIALHETFGYGLAILWDEANFYNEESEIPVLAHVFATDGKRAIDVKGVRSVNDIKRDYYDLEQPVVDSVGLSELKTYMNDSDDYPLMPYSEEEINEAKKIIAENPQRYSKHP